jgi:hypothetical protein
MSRPIPIQFIGNIIRQKMTAIEKRVHAALVRTAIDAGPMIRKRTPKAFGELQASVQGYSKGSHGGPVTAVDAPHAKAVEIGTGPHQPNMEKLTEWVRLRGMQGLTGRGRLRKRFPKSSMGFTTPRQAKRVAGMIKPLEVRAQRSRKARGRKPGRDAHGRHLPVDAARQVAERIAAGIRKHGTAPFWMVRRSLPEIAATMGRRVRAAVKK